MAKRKTGPGELVLDGKGWVRMRKPGPRTWTSAKERQFLIALADLQRQAGRAGSRGFAAACLCAAQVARRVSGRVDRSDRDCLQTARAGAARPGAERDREARHS